MSEHGETSRHDDTRIAEQLRDSVSDVTFSERMKQEVLDELEGTDAEPRLSLLYRFATGVAAAAALVVLLNVGMLFITTDRTRVPEYAVTQLPGAAINYNEELQQ